MPSELNVNKISPASGTSVTLGDSGDTFTVPSGVTLSGSGASLTSLPAANLTGTLPAISGASLTGLPVTGWEFVSSATASNTASIALTGLSVGYDYQIEGWNISLTNPAYGELYVGVSGPTYRTTNYFGGTTSLNVNTSAIATTGMVTDKIRITGAGAWGGTDKDGHFSWVFSNPASATATGHMGFSAHQDNGAVQFNETGGGQHRVAEAIDAIKFQANSGNIITGEVTFYRRKLS